MTPDECKPGTVVQWGGPPPGVAVVLRVDGTMAAVHNIERPDGTKAWTGTGHVRCSELTLAPRFLVSGEWVHIDAPFPPNVQGVIQWVEPSHAIGRGWHWAVFGDAARSAAQNLNPYAQTYHAARLAVERAAGAHK